MCECFAAKIWQARMPAFLAPFIATAATGTPGGIWAMERSESRPSRLFVLMGTPMTGRGVSDATMPGR